MTEQTDLAQQTSLLNLVMARLAEHNPNAATLADQTAQKDIAWKAKIRDENARVYANASSTSYAMPAFGMAIYPKVETAEDIQEINNGCRQKAIRKAMTAYRIEPETIGLSNTEKKAIEWGKGERVRKFTRCLPSCLKRPV